MPLKPVGRRPSRGSRKPESGQRGGAGRALRDEHAQDAGMGRPGRIVQCTAAAALQRACVAREPRR